MDRYPKHPRDGRESYREQSHSLRNLRRPEGGWKTDKPTPSAQSSDDFVTSAMKSIFGEDYRGDLYETSGSRARNDAHEDDLGTDYRDLYETSGSRDHN